MDLNELNHTELVALARMIDPHVTRGYDRFALIAILDEDEDLNLDKPAVDFARDDIYQMVNHYWHQVESLISCPMKSREARACYGCSEIQVAECTISNENLIRKVKEGGPHE